MTSLFKSEANASFVASVKMDPLLAHLSTDQLAALMRLIERDRAIILDIFTGAATTLRTSASKDTLVGETAHAVANALDQLVGVYQS